MIQVENRDSALTIVAFSGLASTNRVYEWTRSLVGIDANFVGVRDPYRSWYQTDQENLFAEVKEACAGKRIVTLGASAGGFAALLFGRRLGAECILAMSPQSACGETKRILGDCRWPELCEKTSSFDLCGPWPEAVIHVAADEPLDILHARRLLPSKELIVHQEGGHNLPSRLKEDGKLFSVIKETFLL